MNRNVGLSCLAILVFCPRLIAECGPPPSACEAFADAGLVIYGEVVEATYHPDYVGPNESSTFGHQDVRLNVLRAFKGARNGVFGGTFRMGGEAVPFVKGRRYLVVASQRDRQWFTACGRTTEIWLQMKPEEIEQLKEVEACLMFLEPDNIAPRVMRGRMFILEADDQPVVPVRSAWGISASYSYAYIPAPGRRAGDITAENDIGWPFIVEGEFDDETLVSIVVFVRSKPLATPKGKGTPTFVPDAPVSRIRRLGNEIEVLFRLGNAGLGRGQWQSVRVVRKGGRWVITDFKWWIV